MDACNSLTNEYVKTCKKHGQLTKEQVRPIRKNKDSSYYYLCLQCRKEIASNNYNKNHEKIYNKTKKYREENQDKIREIRRTYYHKKKDTINQYAKKYRDRADVKVKTRLRDKRRKDKEISRKDLHPSYVVQTITKRTNLKASDIPPSLIEFKRTIILIKRTMKEHKKLNRLEEIQGKMNHEN